MLTLIKLAIGQIIQPGVTICIGNGNVNPVVFKLPWFPDRQNGNGICEGWYRVSQCAVEAYNRTGNENV